MSSFTTRVRALWARWRETDVAVEKARARSGGALRSTGWPGVFVTSTGERIEIADWTDFVVAFGYGVHELRVPGSGKESWALLAVAGQPTEGYNPAWSRTVTVGGYGDEAVANDASWRASSLAERWPLPVPLMREFLAPAGYTVVVQVPPGLRLELFFLRRRPVFLRRRPVT